MVTRDITDEDVKNLKNLLDYFRTFTAGGINSLEERWLIQMLDYSLRFYAYIVFNEVFTQVERITINKRIHGSNKRIKEISQLKYPPENIVTKYGRCNLPHQSVFYGTFAWMIALNEMKPKVGDLITRTTWTNRGEISIQYCPIFLNQPGSNFINPRTLEMTEIFNREIVKKFPEKVRLQIFDLTQFIADTFSCRIDPTNDRDYLFSAYFSNKILHEFENGTIDAIYYPSVQEKLSFENIAIKPNIFDKIFELTKVHESIVVQNPRDGFKGYIMKGIAECKSFDYAAGKILWENGEITHSLQEIESLKKQYDLDID